MRNNKKELVEIDIPGRVSVGTVTDLVAGLETNDIECEVVDNEILRLRFSEQWGSEEIKNVVTYIQLVFSSDRSFINPKK